MKTGKLALCGVCFVLVLVLGAFTAADARMWTYYDIDNKVLADPSDEEIKESAVRRNSDDGLTQYVLEIEHNFSGTWGTGYLENIGNPSPGTGKHWIAQNELLQCKIDGIVEDAFQLNSRYISTGYVAQGAPNNIGKASALKFDGSNDYVTANSIALNDKQFSIEFRAKRDQTGRKDHIIGQGTTATNKGFVMGFRADNKFEFGLSGREAAVSSNSYTDNDWHHWKCELKVTEWQGQYLSGFGRSYSYHSYYTDCNYKICDRNLASGYDFNIS